jgi:hypothetical protein
VVDAVVLANGTLNALDVVEVVSATFVAFVAVVAVPLKDAVIVPAAKFPLASRATIVEAPFASVAFEPTVKVLLPDWFAVNDAEPVRPTPDTFIVKVPSLGADNAAQVESPRKNVVLLAVPEAKRAVGTVPLAIAVAFNEVNAEPLPDTETNPPELAEKLPLTSRAIIVEAPFDAVAVVLALARVPLVMLSALVVSVVAEAAKPDTLDAVIAIPTLEALVI